MFYKLCIPTSKLSITLKTDGTTLIGMMNEITCEQMFGLQLHFKLCIHLVSNFHTQTSNVGSLCLRYKL